MGTATALVLGAGLARVPAVMVQVPQVIVNCLCKEGTATDGPIGPVTIFVLLVSFIENFPMSYIQFFNSGIVHIGDEGIKETVKVFQTFLTCI